MKSLDAESIRKALTTARDGGFRSIKLKAGESSFQAVLSEEALTWGESWSDEDGDVEPGPSTKPVSAPVVGYVRWIPELGQVGAEIKAGQAVGEVLALGISNEVVSEHAGKVVAVLVEDGAAVEYGQSMLEVELK